MRYGGHRAAAGLEIEARADRGLSRRLRRAASARRSASGADPHRGRRRGRRRREPRPRGRRAARAAGAVRQGQPRCPAAGPGGRASATCGRWGRATATPASASAAAPAGARGRLRRQRRARRGAASGPLDVSVKLELNEWNGAVEPRVVLETIALPRSLPPEEPDDRRLLRRAGAGSARRSSGAASTPSSRASSSLAASPSRPPSGARERVDRRGASGVAAIAALASSGEAVLARLRRCDPPPRAGRARRAPGALRRRRAGARLGAAARGAIAVAAARVPRRAPAWCSPTGRRSRATRLARAGFEHLVVVDPPPFAHLDATLRRRARLPAPGRRHARGASSPCASTPTSGRRGARWRALPGAAWARGREGSVAAASARALLCGEGRSHPLSPEAAARSARVLAELGLVRWERSGAARALGVVSSEGTDLERSAAFVAYRDRYEEGRRYLSKRRQHR